MEELKVGTVIISKQLQDSANYKKFKQIVKRNKIKVIFIGESSESTPSKLSIDSNIYLEFLWPNSLNFISENPLNNNSIVCKLHYNIFSILFTGDIEEIAEKQIVKRYKNNLKSTILKVGHHGSKTSSIQEFVEAVNPKLALIGVGENNKFGHPNEEVLQKFENMRYKNI